MLWRGRGSANGGRLANGRYAQADPQKTADGLDELGHRDRLRQISLATAFTDTLLVALHRKGGHRDYRNGLEFGSFLQVVEELHVELVVLHDHYCLWH